MVFTYLLLSVFDVPEILQVTDKCDFSPFDGLHLVDLETRKRYCSRQLNVLMSSNAVLKGNIFTIVPVSQTIATPLLDITLVNVNQFPLKILCGVSSRFATRRHISLVS